MSSLSKKPFLAAFVLALLLAGNYAVYQLGKQRGESERGALEKTESLNPDKFNSQVQKTEAVAKDLKKVSNSKVDTENRVNIEGKESQEGFLKKSTFYIKDLERFKPLAPRSTQPAIDPESEEGKERLAMLEANKEKHCRYVAQKVVSDKSLQFSWLEKMETRFSENETALLELRKIKEKAKSSHWTSVEEEVFLFVKEKLRD